MKKFDLAIYITLHCIAILLMATVLSCSPLMQNRFMRITSISNVVFIAPDDTTSLTVAEKNDLISLKTVLNISGISITEISIKNIPVTKLSVFNLIVVPFASAKMLRAPLKITFF